MVTIFHRKKAVCPLVGVIHIFAIFFYQFSVHNPISPKCWKIIWLPPKAWNWLFPSIISKNSRQSIESRILLMSFHVRTGDIATAENKLCLQNISHHRNFTWFEKKTNKNANYYSHFTGKSSCFQVFIPWNICHYQINANRTRHFPGNCLGIGFAHL